MAAFRRPGHPMNPQHILIIRLSAIGDVVMSSAMIPVLRRAWPNARIAWLVEPAGAGLLRANPHLDEVIVWPRGDWKKLWQTRRYGEWRRAVTDFVRALRARGFDLVLDAQGLLKSGIWARASGAPRRVGLGSREGSQWLMTETLSRRGEDRRIGSEYLKLMRHLGLEPGDFRMDLACAEQDVVVARRLLTGAGVGGEYAVIAPFTTRPQKHWFEDRWAALIERLQRELDLPVLMLGGPGDRAAAARVRAAAPEVRDLVGHTTIAQSVAVIRDAALLVGVDTGLTHMGTACARPTVALFGATRPYLDPAVESTRILYQDIACSPCRFHPTCNGAYTCMKLISVDRVMQAVTALLEPATG